MQHHGFGSGDPIQALEVHTYSVLLQDLKSYSFAKGALLRQRNPDVIHAAWVSSAPVEAQVDMASYYKAAERSLSRNCSNDWVSVTKFVDDTLINSKNTTQVNWLKFRVLKAALSGPGGNETGAANLTVEGAALESNLNVASTLMDPLDFYQVPYHSWIIANTKH